MKRNIDEIEKKAKALVELPEIHTQANWNKKLVALRAELAQARGERDELREAATELMQCFDLDEYGAVWGNDPDETEAWEEINNMQLERDKALAKLEAALERGQA